MKKIFTILCSTFIGTLAFGQLVPNGDFEGTADWKTLGSPAVLLDKVTINLQGGGTEELLPVGGKKLAVLQSAQFTSQMYQKFAYTQRPNSLRFMFCYLPINNNVASVFVRLTKYNTTTQKVDTLLAFGVGLQGATYPWKEFALELSDKYKMAGNPDTAYVYFNNSLVAPHSQGTALILDNVKFSPNAATIKDIDNAIVGKPSASPNPFVSTSTINFQTNTTSEVSIELYDMTGKMVKQILNEKLPYGKHTAEINAEGLNPGIYFYKISTGSYTTTEKVIISR